jgi:cytoskeletal protein CcmA (bactofilin family)
VFSVDTKTNSSKPAAVPFGSVPRPPLAAAPAPPKPVPQANTAAASGVSVIGRDLTILGEKITIVSQNRLQVEGDVRGDVHGKQVTIVAGGSVVGLVRAERIDVHGTVSGAIRAVTVIMHATARVDGDVTHQSLGIAEGAHFEGRVHRSDDMNELMPVLDPEAIAASGGNAAGHGSNGSGEFM